MFVLNHDIVNKLLNSSMKETSSVEEQDKNRDIQEFCHLWLQKWTLEWAPKVFHRGDSYFAYNLIEIGSLNCYGKICYVDNKFSTIINKQNTKNEYFSNEIDARNWLRDQAEKDGYVVKR